MRHDKKTLTTSQKPLLGRSHAKGPFPTSQEREREELIRDWYDGTDHSAVLAALHPQTQRVGELVDQVMDGFQSPDDRVMSGIQMRWGEVASNEALVQKLCPVHLANEVLTIEVADATLLYVFREPRLQERLLAAVNQIAEGKVKRLRMVMKRQCGG